MSFAATELSTPPLTAPITRPFGPQISRMRAISFPMNSSCNQSEILSLSPHCSRCAYHSPVLFATTDAQHEFTDDFSSPLRMGDLGVELNAVERLRVMCDCGKGCSIRAANDVEIGGKLRQLISMRHPDLDRVQTRVSFW